MAKAEKAKGKRPSPTAPPSPERAKKRKTERKSERESEPEYRCPNCSYVGTHMGFKGHWGRVHAGLSYLGGGRPRFQFTSVRGSKGLRRLPPDKAGAGLVLGVATRATAREREEELEYIRVLWTDLDHNGLGKGPWTFASAGHRRARSGAPMARGGVRC